MTRIKIILITILLSACSNKVVFTDTISGREYTLKAEETVELLDFDTLDKTKIIVFRKEEDLIFGSTLDYLLKNVFLDSIEKKRLGELAGSLHETQSNFDLKMISSTKDQLILESGNGFIIHKGEVVKNLTIKLFCTKESCKGFRMVKWYNGKDLLYTLEYTVS